MMANYFNLNEFLYYDYANFGIGFALLAVAFILLISNKSKKSSVGIKRTLFFLISFIFLLGLSFWGRVVLVDFPDFYLFQRVYLGVTFLAYFFLLEFSLQVLVKRKFLYYLIYVVPLVGLINGVTFHLFLDFFIVISIFFAGLAINQLFSEYRLFLKNIMRFKSIIVNALYSISILLLFISITYYGVGYQSNSLFIYKYILEVFFSSTVSLIFMHSLLKFTNKDPLEVQLRRFRLRIIKGTLFTLLFVYFSGYFYVSHISQKQWKNESQQLIGYAKLAALSINGEYFSSINQLENEELLQLRKKLMNLKASVPNIHDFYLIGLSGDERNFQFQLFNEDRKKGDMILDYFYKDTVLRQGLTNIFELNNREDIITITPILDNDGSISVLFGIDIDGKNIIQSIQVSRISSIATILALMIVVIGSVNFYYINHREGATRSNQNKILSSIGDIVGVFDDRGNIIYANTAAYKLTGTIQNRRNVNIKDFLNTTDSIQLLELFGSIKKDEVIYSEFTLNTVNGEKIPIYGSLSFLDYEHNKSLYVFTAMNISEQKQREKEIQANFQNTLSLLATVIDAKDEYTARHSTNVARYARSIARELGLDEEIASEIEAAAMVHDIGKIAIPDQVLKKEGGLLEEEWFEMRLHPEYGKTILEKAGATFQKFIPYAYYHHERYDGKGYPLGLKNVPLPIAIIAVADAFDAMTSNRAYRKKMTLEDAKQELVKNAGSQFNPLVVDAVIKLLENDKEFYRAEENLLILGNSKL